MINLDRNFTKIVSSKRKAVSLVNKIAEKYNDRVMSSTHRKVGRLTLEVYGTQKNFRWKYNPEYKELYVTYTDGRPEPVEVEPKNTYYVIWVEGLNPRHGEKIERFRLDNTIEYTCKMSQAMRILEKDIPAMREKLKDFRLADWVIDSGRTFVKTHYAPKGTLYKLNGKTQKEVAKEAIDQIMDAVNIMGSDKQVVEGVVEGLSLSHRTLQQNFWRVMMQVIKEYSEFRSDLRNEGAVELCKFIKEQVETNNKEYLPYI